jgi:hypothetical protein
MVLRSGWRVCGPYADKREQRHEGQEGGPHNRFDAGDLQRVLLRSRGLAGTVSWRPAT